MATTGHPDRSARPEHRTNHTPEILWRCNEVPTASYFKSRKSLRVSFSNSRTCHRSAIASSAKNPCLRAFSFPRGAPAPSAPPCMRQRALPCTAGAPQGLPLRVRAPHRGLASMAPVLRAWPLTRWRLGLRRQVRSDVRPCGPTGSSLRSSDPFRQGRDSPAASHPPRSGSQYPAPTRPAP